VTTSPPYALLAPEETVSLTVSVAAPEALPFGQYRGLLALPGVGGGGLPVVVDVTAGPAEVIPQPLDPTVVDRTSRDGHAAAARRRARRCRADHRDVARIAGRTARRPARGHRR
jgi:hypothetical protein